MYEFKDEFLTGIEPMSCMTSDMRSSSPTSMTTSGKYLRN